MPTFVLTSQKPNSCDKKRWWCRNVRCDCRFVGSRTEQVCAVDAPSAGMAATFLGGNLTGSVWGDHRPCSLGLAVSYGFTPGTDTADAAFRANTAERLGKDADTNDHRDRRSWLHAHMEFMERKTSFENHRALLHEALQDGTRRWSLVTVPKFARQLADSPHHENVEEARGA